MQLLCLATDPPDPAPGCNSTRCRHPTCTRSRPLLPAAASPPHRAWRPQHLAPLAARLAAAVGGPAAAEPAVARQEGRRTGVACRGEACTRVAAGGSPSLGAVGPGACREAACRRGASQAACQEGPATGAAGLASATGSRMQSMQPARSDRHEAAAHPHVWRPAGRRKAGRRPSGRRWPCGRRSGRCWWLLLRRRLLLGGCAGGWSSLRRSPERIAGQVSSKSRNMSAAASQNWASKHRSAWCRPP